MRTPEEAVAPGQEITLQYCPLTPRGRLSSNLFMGLSLYWASDPADFSPRGGLWGRLSGMVPDPQCLGRNSFVHEAPCPTSLSRLSGALQSQGPQDPVP